MEFEKARKPEKKTQTVTYYGKKAYRIHPRQTILAPLKPLGVKIPDFGRENISDKKEQKINY